MESRFYAFWLPLSLALHLLALPLLARMRVMGAPARTHEEIIIIGTDELIASALPPAPPAPARATPFRAAPRRSAHAAPAPPAVPRPVATPHNAVKPSVSLPVTRTAFPVARPLAMQPRPVFTSSGGSSAAVMLVPRGSLDTAGGLRGPATAQSARPDAAMGMPTAGHTPGMPAEIGPSLAASTRGAWVVAPGLGEGGTGRSAIGIEKGRPDAVGGALPGGQPEARAGRGNSLSPGGTATAGRLLLPGADVALPAPGRAGGGSGNLPALPGVPVGEGHRGNWSEIPGTPVGSGHVFALAEKAGPAQGNPGSGGGDGVGIGPVTHASGPLAGTGGGNTLRIATALPSGLPGGSGGRLNPDMGRLRFGSPAASGTGRGDWRDAPAGVPGGTGPGGGTGDERALPSYGISGGAGPTPVLPTLALLEGLTGTVEVSVLVDVDGRVVKATVTKRSDYDSLDNAAVRSARDWAFRPAFDRGKAITATVRMRFVFTKEKVTVSQL